MILQGLVIRVVGVVCGVDGARVAELSTGGGCVVGIYRVVRWHVAAALCGRVLKGGRQKRRRLLAKRYVCVCVVLIVCKQAASRLRDVRVGVQSLHGRRRMKHSIGRRVVILLGRIAVQFVAF